MSAAVTYRPRNPEENPLYGVIAEHLETFLARQRQRDRNVPEFVEKCGAPYFSTTYGKLVDGQLTRPYFAERRTAG